MGLDSVTFSFEVGRVGNVIEYKVDADDGKSVVRIFIVHMIDLSVNSLKMYMKYLSDSSQYLY